MQHIFRAGLFDGEVAIVTGGGTGIGLAVARELGTLGANTQRTGGVINTDLSLVKNIKTFSESQRLQLRWEMTDVFNRRNFTIVPANVASDNTNMDLFLNLGQTNVAGRTMLFTLRYFF